LPAAAVREHLGVDKKHAGGRLRWVLPTADGIVVRSDIPDDVVEAALAGLLEPAASEAGAR
jgi:3-dehydroquinate synthetase